MKVGSLLQFGNQKPSFGLGIVLNIEKAGAVYGSADDAITIYMKWLDPLMASRNPVHVWHRNYVEEAFKVISK